MRPIDCDEAGDRLHGFLDRELKEAEIAEVQSHLESCEECRSKFRFQASFKKLIRTQSSGQSAPADLRERLTQRAQSTMDARDTRTDSFETRKR